MLLKMRSLPPKATPRPDNGILKAVDGSDMNAARWFDMIKVSREFTIHPVPEPQSLSLQTKKQLCTLNNDRRLSSIPTTLAPSISATEQNCCHLRTFTHDLRWSTNCD
ncbi:unnamed protein product [Aspergillus oryzae]|uniref:Unnamed protein product n=1 Tax=Aspergillus oryzae TaxID=5062 RepID=A0AAN5C1V7_ASPOZ|nr:unnamed protein product [Aspergillus oryzae]GMF96579.1 unnamed protein product [Aspergillus oryzae]GMG14064.1 unnamed protein product [Aspergillus oryzae]GMG34520.1 unnamed protein product [Aspergillus oryzae]